MRKYETEFKFKVVKSFLDGDGGARLDEGGVEAFGFWEQERSSMKNEQRSPVPPSAAITDSEQVLREENERLRAEVAYLKKLQALIRSKISAASTKRDGALSSDACAAWGQAKYETQG